MLIDQKILVSALKDVPANLAFIIIDAINKYAELNKIFETGINVFAQRGGFFSVTSNIIKFSEIIMRPNGKFEIALNPALFFEGTWIGPNTRREAVAKEINSALSFFLKKNPLNWSIQQAIIFLRVYYRLPVLLRNNGQTPAMEFNSEYLNELARSNICQNPAGNLIYGPQPPAFTYHRCTERSFITDALGSASQRYVFGPISSHYSHIDRVMRYSTKVLFAEPLPWLSPWYYLTPKERAAAESFFAVGASMQEGLRAFISNIVVNMIDAKPFTACYHALLRCLTDHTDNPGDCLQTAVTCINNTNVSSHNKRIQLDIIANNLGASTSFCWPEPTPEMMSFNITRPASQEYVSSLNEEKSSYRRALFSSALASGINAFLFQLIELSSRALPSKLRNILLCAGAILIPTLLNMIFSYSDTSFKGQLLATSLFYCFNHLLMAYLPYPLYSFVEKISMPFLFVFQVGFGGWKACLANQAAQMTGKSLAQYLWTKRGGFPAPPGAAPPINMLRAGNIP